MSNQLLFFVIPSAIFTIVILLIWIDMIRFYKKANPEKDFNFYMDQMFVFYRLDPNKPFGDDFNKRRRWLFLVLLLAIIHQILDFYVFKFPG